MINWDDLKYFLAMAEAGSLSAASRKLGVSQPTLSRRLIALEEGMGVELFLRTRNGLEVTALAESIIDRARHMQDDIYAIERMITGQGDALKGSVVVSAAELVGSNWLVRKLRPFHDLYPSITVDISVANSAADLLRREADIALRMFQPTQGDLIAKRTVTMNYGYYASQDYIDRRGKPERLSELRDHAVVLPHDEILAASKAKIRHALPGPRDAAFRSNSFAALTTAVREGYGIGAVSCLTAVDDPSLIRLFDDYVVASMDIWLVAHAELRRSARIRAMYDFIGDMLMDNARAFDGC